MAESNILSEPVLEEFRCFRCKHFLCTPPIVVLPNGNSLCGICSTSAEETTYRVLILENFLKTLKFPCKFKINGCTTWLRFGETQEHEADCIHRPRTCPVSPTCAWEGAIQQMCDHFSINHSDMMTDKIEFKLNVGDKDEDGLLLACVNGITGILRYSYNLAFGNLKYDIQHFNADYDEILLKVSITNNLDLDYKVHTKGGASSFFNASFYRDIHENLNVEKLSLSNFFPILDNPDCIVINLDWQVKKSKKVFLGNDAAQPVNLTEVRELVNYALLDTLKCGICRCYLLAPLYYEKPGSTCVMCWYCHNKFPKAQPVLEQDNILKEVEKTYFPCRWRGCEVIKLGSDLISHELSCMLRMYNCRDCENNSITKKDIAVHAETHKYVYFQDCVTLSKDCCTSLTNGHYITHKNNNIYYITVYTDFTDFSSLWFHFDSEYYTKDSLIVEFEHGHCKFKPTFTVKPSESLHVTKEKIPTCFKLNKTVTLKV